MDENGLKRAGFAFGMMTAVGDAHPLAALCLNALRREELALEEIFAAVGWTHEVQVLWYALTAREKAGASLVFVCGANGCERDAWKRNGHAVNGRCLRHGGRTETLSEPSGSIRRYVEFLRNEHACEPCR